MDELDRIKTLAGIGNRPNWSAYPGINISVSGTEKAQIQREHKIEPGTQEWFKLWFSLPYLTGEKPV